MPKKASKLGNQQLLNQVINESLLTLGEPIMETIQWHLKAHGVFVDSSDDLNLRLFYQQLQQIVGNMADMIMDELYDSLRQSSHDTSLQLDASEPVVSRIEQLLALNMAGGSSK